VGFISGDLRHHAVAGFIEPVWRALAGGSLEVWVYSNTPVEDRVSARLREHVLQWQQVFGLPDADLVSRIRADEIDILIDLSGHTAHNRLSALAYKPAPIQVSWIGYPGTTGLEAIDYLLCDPFNAPPGLYEQFYTEKFARLPSTGAFAPAREAPPVSTLPALANGYITFGSFNHPNKIGAAVLAAWAEVLRAVPDSCLLIANMSDPAQQQRLTATLVGHGIAAVRLRFSPRLSLPDYLALHQEVDLLLDTWPYTGGTTSNHAVWMGVPVVTLRGPSRCHCQSAAVMERVGLAAWVADDVAGYVRIARQQAEDVAGLAALGASLRQRWQDSPWRDSTAIAGWLEQGLRAMWQRWCQGLPAEHFQIMADGRLEMAGGGHD
jgi:predicted O-linked N-acetylglucosamine transferase (SPINDLY family)